MRRIFGFFLLMSVAATTPLAAQEIPQALNKLDQDIHQAVIVDAAAGSTNAQVSGWERRDGRWQRAVDPMPAVIGRNGLAPEGEKREGDGRTPSGVFALRRAFGYLKKIETGLEYRAVTKKDFWIDAPDSLFYNQWVSGSVPEVSHEVLRRRDGLYKYAVVVEYNTDPAVPGMGSAIFMHVWRNAGSPTAGCVAMAEKDLKRFLAWLDAGDNPVMILQGT